MKRIAAVHILNVPYHIDRQYDYKITSELAGKIKPGSFVAVPFGKVNKSETAVVTELKESSEFGNLKYIKQLYDYPVDISEELLGLCEFIKDRCFCSFGTALKTALPPGITLRSEAIYVPVAPEKRGELPPINEASKHIFETVCENGGITEEELCSSIGEEAPAVLKALENLGYLEKTLEVKTKLNEKKQKFVRLAISSEEAKLYLDGDKFIANPKQLRMLGMMNEYPIISEKELLEYCHASKSLLSGLCRRGLAEIYEQNIDRSSSVFSVPEAKEYELSDEQNAAYNELCGLMDSGEAKAALLHGVTGSGKTKVIVSAVKYALEKGRNAIVLVPEIGLTTQAINIFASYFGDKVALVHSGLSVGERLDAYRRIAQGGAQVVIGTRSAVFAPLDNIGIIVIDEEQEHTYKSERSPKYHTSDIAKYRCAYHKALFMTASATPSVETYYKAKLGVYKLIELKNRYGGLILPEVIIEDLRNDEDRESGKMLGSCLRRHIKENLAQGEQTILLLNRRGYNSHVSCMKCGEVMQCPNCSVSLTYHAHSTDGLGGRLICHYCGYSAPQPKLCASCGSAHFAYLGSGTQKLEDELSEAFPEARAVRMDADTTALKNSHSDIYELFKSGGADILYGTQMIAKGLDFPNVTLVGIILADSTLYMNDFRANERAFSLMTQVVGRAGRASGGSRAVIQTYTPEHEVLKLAAAQCYPDFFEGDISVRKAVCFPPFCDIALFSFIGDVESDVKRLSERFTEELVKLHELKYKALPLIKFGPFSDGIYKINNRFRRKLIVKFKNSKKSREMLHEIMVSFSKVSTRSARVEIDINPNIV